MLEHVPYKCPDDCNGCCYCHGGLILCTVCNALEGSLTTECCGRPITAYEENRIYNEANLDYKNGKWINVANYPRPSKEDK